MNMFAKLALAAVIGSLAISGAANAQTKPDSATADVNGNAMKSTNNQQYVQLQDGEAVKAGDAIMVSPDSSVVLTVTDGTRSWQVTLPPGTYRVTPGLLRSTAGGTIASQSTGNLAFTVGTILGTVGLAAAGMNSMDEVPPLHPVSR
jgi:hypothetical protein